MPDGPITGAIITFASRSIGGIGLGYDRDRNTTENPGHSGFC